MALLMWITATSMRLMSLNLSRA
ncbi:unnamed protein product [Callosobruchus maculatus]|uniref:Uncharacterized protein n=1 Tax=Callosobruchus maculatus TaxID=64391 RepID=A0A653BLR2_CALMS|nr:unnamed protein product [Callosobruchus maculatus]